MTTKSVFIRARTEPRIKKQAENIFHILGLSTTEALNLFYKQVILNRGIPFDVKIPNQETLKVFKDTDTGKNVVKHKNKEELFKDLGL